MKAVVDTNVVAYYLVGNTEFESEAKRFWQSVRDPLAPAIWEAEIANVVWMAISMGVLFVELAEREGAPLVTFDQRLLKAWPTIAYRPGAVTRR